VEMVTRAASSSVDVPIPEVVAQLKERVQEETLLASVEK
jgi:hypothetical protein